MEGSFFFGVHCPPITCGLRYALAPCKIVRKEVSKKPRAINDGALAYVWEKKYVLVLGRKLRPHPLIENVHLVSEFGR